MNQDELIAKLAPAIGLRRMIDPRIKTDTPKYADPILAVRQLHPEEQAFADDTLDTILVERETEAFGTDDSHTHAFGLVAASSQAMQLTWFPGSDPTIIRLFVKGISATTSRPTTYVQMFHGSKKQITAAIATAQAANAWQDADLTKE